jgi:arginase
VRTTIAVHARISERTPRDLRGVALLEGLLRPGARRVLRIDGRSEPFGETGWEADLEASRPTLEAVRGATAQALELGEVPVVLASDCAIALATVPALREHRPDARLLWLDAHSDYDTPATSGYSFLGCMSLAGATGAWNAGTGAALAPQRVVLCGSRAMEGDFDAAAQAAVAASPLTVVPIDGREQAAVVAALGDAPAYVHLDPDVLDVGVNPVPYGRPGGFDLEGLHGLLEAVAARGPVVGVEVSAFHTSDDADERERLGAALAACVRVLAAS